MLVGSAQCVVRSLHFVAAPRTCPRTQRSPYFLGVNRHRRTVNPPPRTPQTPAAPTLTLVSLKSTPCFCFVPCFFCDGETASFCECSNCEYCPRTAHSGGKIIPVTGTNSPFFCRQGTATMPAVFFGRIRPPTPLASAGWKTGLSGGTKGSSGKEELLE